MSLINTEKTSLDYLATLNSRSLKMFPCPEQTYVIIVATFRERRLNQINRINCKKGFPIGGYLFDNQTDSYVIECADYLHLGYIPASFKARMKDVTHWEMRVPMSETMLKKFFTEIQKKEIKNFKSKFKIEEFEIQYIQMIDVN